MSKIRAIWRRWFAPDPPSRLTGFAMQFRAVTTRGDYIENWNAVRAQIIIEERWRKAAWQRGERFGCVFPR